MICPSCHAENEASAESCFECGKALYALTHGSVLSSRYEILSALGKGGMGIVYKAHDRALDETVAVKVLREATVGPARAAKRFRSEIKLARRVRHRNVCAIHEYGQHDHIRYIVMEFVDGVDLRQVIQETGPLAPAVAFSASIQAARALEAIHEVGIVHRDLKTSNMMIDSQALVRVMDFGLAKSLQQERATGVTETGNVLGTPEYMSPEQARGEKNIDGRSDLYALGIVIHELFTGELPLQGDSPVVTLFKHIHEAPSFNTPAAARLPGPLTQVLRKALAKSREKRFASARAMVDALEQVQIASVPAGEITPTSFPVAAALARSAPPPETSPNPTPSPASPTLTAKTRFPPDPPSGRPEPPPAAVTPVSPRKLPERLRPREKRRAARSAVRRVPAPRVTHWMGAIAVALIGVGAALWFTVYPKPPTGELDDRGSDPPIHSAPQDPVVRPGALPLDLPPAEPSAGAEPEPGRPQTTSAPITSPPSDPPPTVGATKPPLDEGRPTTAPTPPTPEPSNVARRPEVPASDGRPPTRDSGKADSLSEPTPLPDVASRAEPTREGLLVLLIAPWAEVFVDGESRGTTPFKPLKLTAGEHTVVLRHPDYEPLPKKVTIRAGQPTELEVDLPFEAFRKTSR